MKRRQDEQARADADRLRTAQENLVVSTETRNRRFGMMSGPAPVLQPVQATPSAGNGSGWARPPSSKGRLNKGTSVFNTSPQG